MFVKRDNSKTIEEVIERNTGIPIKDFMNPKESPFVRNLTEASNEIKENINNHIPITIVGDYDVDGVCATAILYHTLKAMGADVRTRLPKRFSEGYGLSEKIIDEINEGVVLTVDNGIAAMKAIQKAKEKGLKVIITDHHLGVKDDNENIVLPEADIIIDPHVDDSEYKDYCGSGIAYRLAKELLPTTDLSQLLGLASIATVSDVMPLTGTNRAIVKEGLKTVNKRKNVYGLNALLRELNLNDEIYESDYGFKIGPAINASGRLFDDGASRVLELLKSPQNDKQADFKAKTTARNNENRKNMVKRAMPVAKELIDAKPIVIYDESFGEGIIGIIAGELCEKYECPVIVFTKAEEGMLKGSGRSIPGYHLKNILDSIKDSIVKYGGHEGAAGLSIEADKLSEFKEKFIKAVGPLPEKDENNYYDLEMPDVNGDTVKRTALALKEYAPFGEGNPRIVYHGTIRNLAEFKEMGDGSHFSIYMGTYSIIGFDMTEKYKELGCPKNIEFTGYITENSFNGKYSYKIELIDFDAVE